MSADHMDEFTAAADEADVKARFAEVTDPVQAVGIAAELGFEVTAEEISASGLLGDGELSEGQLENVAGGYFELARQRRPSD